MKDSCRLIINRSAHQRRPQRTEKYDGKIDSQVSSVCILLQLSDIQNKKYEPSRKTSNEDNFDAVTQNNYLNIKLEG